ncbi:MAG: MmgE/PrpD family protein [Deltaproteobacteria bacterium]|nr:MmgE/PrpD family protein [Deltaproteobacteria bacterium]
MDSIAAIARHVAQTSYQDLPASVIENTKKCIIDTLGVGIAGRMAPACPEAFDMVRQWSGRPESTVILRDSKSPAPWAAFVNSIAMHALDFDDTLDESPHHANVSAFPALLAAAEARGSVSGKDLICALALGNDVSCRLALSLKRPLAWTRAATCGHFGATAAVGKISELGEERLVHAFGIVYAQTAGNVQGLLDGALTKRMQPAFAAKNAIVSVELAKRGITGASHVLEGDMGFFRLYEQNEYDKSVLLEDMGKVFAGERLSLKPYPSCRMTHAAIDLAISIRKNNQICLDDVDAVTVTCSRMVHKMVGGAFQIRTNPEVDAQFSIPYTVSIAFDRGDVFLEDFEPDVVARVSAAGLHGRIRVEEDPVLPERDIMQCRMEVRLGDGRILTEATAAPRGSPANPLSMDECIEKFKKCARYGSDPMKEDRIKAMLHLLGDLENLPDISRLMNILS